MKFRSSSLALALLPLAASPAFAADWHMWGGTPQRNMINTVEKNIPDTWDVATGKNIKWVAQLGSQSFGNPVVAGGKIFVGTNNQCRAPAQGQGRQGRRDVLPRGRRQVPLAERPRQAAPRAA